MDLMDDIGQKLIDDGLVDGSSGWKLYKSYLPDSPDQAVVIYERSGVEPDQTIGIAYEYPAFQIYVRASQFKYNLARTKIREIFNSLNNADIAGYVYIYATDSGPILDEYDRENRPAVFWTFKVMKAPNPMVIMGAGDMVAEPEVPAVGGGGGSGSFSITVPSATMGAVGN